MSLSAIILTLSLFGMPSIDSAQKHDESGTTSNKQWRIVRVNRQIRSDGQFHAAIDMLVEVFTKDDSLLHQSALMGIEPEPQYDTHECFTFPLATGIGRDARLTRTTKDLPRTSQSSALFRVQPESVI